MPKILNISKTGSNITTNGIKLIIVTCNNYNDCNNNDIKSQMNINNSKPEKQPMLPQ